MREANIVQGRYELRHLMSVEAKDLIERMIAKDPNRRPSAADVLVHPFFWSAEKQLNFLMDVSDRFEKEDRDPPSKLLLVLEEHASFILKGDWHKQVDRAFLDNLGKYRKYQPDRVLDLLRALRNKKHHYHELPEPLKKQVGPVPEGYVSYFLRRFDHLLIYCYYIVSEHLRDEPTFQPYFTTSSPTL